MNRFLEKFDNKILRNDICNTMLNLNLLKKISDLVRKFLIHTAQLIKVCLRFEIMELIKASTKFTLRLNMNIMRK